MCRCIAVGLLIGGLCGVAVAQDRATPPERGGFGPPGSGFTGGRSAAGSARSARAAAPSGPIKAAGPLLKLEVIIAELDQAASNEEVTAESVVQLAKEGKLPSLMRISLLALNHQPAFAQRGRRLPVATARSRTAGGPGRESPFATAYEMANVGTIISATSAIDDRGFIVTNLDAEISSVPASPAAAAPQQPSDAPGPIPVSVTIQTTLRLEPGKPAIAAEIQSAGGNDSRRQLLLVSGSIVGDMPAQAANATPADESAVVTKVFTLRHISSHSAQNTIQGLFAGDGDVRIMAEAESNSLVMRATPQQFAVIEALLIRLDESVSERINALKAEQAASER